MKFPSKKFLSLVRLVGFGGLLVIMNEPSTEAQTLPPDVGIITQLSGGVTYRNEDYQKTSERAQAFMKILRGDDFKVGAKALVQLVYFRSGRKETWKGPAAFIVGETQSRAKSQKGIQAQPEVKILPAVISAGMQRIPALLERAGISHLGITQVRDLSESFQKSEERSREEQNEILMAKENYRNLRNQMEADDITPELYLLGILADDDQFEEMDKVIAVALKKQPDNEILKKLEEWVLTEKTQPTK